MNLQQQLATELCRRAQLLPQEITDWQTQTEKNIAGMGIHQSQIRVVSKLFDGMLTKQNALIAEFDPDEVGAIAQEEFTRKRMALEQSLTGTHSIMATFRYIFAQRDESQQYKKVLDAADLIAAYC